MAGLEPTPFSHVLVYRPSSPPLVPYDAFGEAWPSWGDWVGDGSEFLNTPNEDVSFGRILEAAESGSYGVGKRYGPWVPPDGFDPSSLTVSFQASGVDDTPLRFRVTIETTFGGPGSFASINTETTPAVGWHTGNLVFGIIVNPTLRGLFLDAIADGNVVVYASAFVGDTGDLAPSFKVSWLELSFISGILPLRQFPRNDGLRGGAPSYKGTSRQGSTARRTYL